MNFGDDLPAALVHDPFKAIVAPRPIGWIGTLSSTGVANLAPYSFFTAVSSRPRMVGFSSEGAKHSAVNARERGEFTVSFVSARLFAAMNASSAEVGPELGEFDLAGLAQGRSVEIAAPFVAESPAALECVTVSVERLRDRDGTDLDRHFVVGQVVRIHLLDAYVTDGRFDTARADPVTRAGYRDYMSAGRFWEADRPKR